MCVKAAHDCARVCARVRVRAEKHIWHETAKPGAHLSYTPLSSTQVKVLFRCFALKRYFFHRGALFHHKNDVHLNLAHLNVSDY